MDTGGRWGLNYILLAKFSYYYYNSKEESKGQESIQSSTIPDPGHHMGKWQKHKKTSHKDSQEVSLFQACGHKAAINRQDSMNKKHLLKKINDEVTEYIFDMSNVRFKEIEKKKMGGVYTLLCLR